MPKKPIEGALANEITDLLIDRVTFHRYRCPHMDECRKTFEEPKDLFLHITTHVSCYAPFALVIDESVNEVRGTYFSITSENLFSYLI